MPTMIPVKCNKCNKDFEVELKRYNSSKTKNFYCSTECCNHKNSIKYLCATCGKEVWKKESQVLRSKTGNVYCSRSCANSMNNHLFRVGENNPNYKGVSYRTIAFKTYENKCLVCGWKEDIRILEVHHIDENRNNNSIENLCILCPTCHRKITLGYYKLINNQLVLT